MFGSSSRLLVRPGTPSMSSFSTKSTVIKAVSWSGCKKTLEKRMKKPEILRFPAAEDKGVEPSTGCPATDFESACSPFAYPPVLDFQPPNCGFTPFEADIQTIFYVFPRSPGRGDSIFRSGKYNVPVAVRYFLSNVFVFFRLFKFESTITTPLRS